MARAKAARKKEHPLSLRLPAGDLAVIDRAAGLRGRSRTDFMREAAVRAAEETLLESGLVRMSAVGFGAFAAAIARPATAVPAMIDVLRRPTPWEKDTANEPGRGVRKDPGAGRAG